MGRQAEQKQRVWREVFVELMDKAGTNWNKIDVRCGRSSGWIMHKFDKGYTLMSQKDLLLFSILLNTTEDELTKLPVSPEGQAKQDATDTDNPLVDAINDLNAVVTSAAMTITKRDYVTAKQANEMYDMIRNGFKMLHTDLQQMVSKMDEYWKGGA